MKCGDPTNPAGPFLKPNGDPCGSQVMHGTHRCYMHGGASPAAKMKSEQAMALIRLPAVEALYKVLQTMESVLDQYAQGICLSCGFPNGSVEEIGAVAKAASVTAKTAGLILDRTGLGPKSTVEVKQSDGDLDLKALTDDERARMIALLSQLRELKAEIKARLAAQSDSLFGRTLPNANTMGTLIQ